MGWDYGYGPMMGYHGFGAWGAIGTLFWLIIVVLAIVVLVRVLRGNRNWQWHHESTALDIVKERYAKGEIDTAEFEEKKKALTE